MSLSLVTAPASLPLSVAEIKTGARLDGIDDEDALLMGYLRSAVERVDGRDGSLGRALITQTWDYKIDYFPVASAFARDPHGAIRMPLPPLQSVVSISYVDLAGAEQTLLASLYQVVTDDRAPRIVPAHGATWPDTRDQPEAVTIRFTAGYGDSWNDVPEPIRQALTLMVRDAYDGCETEAARMLLNRYQIINRPGPLPDRRRGIVV